MEFNKKEEYERHIKDNVKQILLACDHYHIPVFMSFAMANKNGETTYENEMLSAAAEGVVLSDDRLVKHALVMDGFSVVPRITIPSIEEEMEVVEDEVEDG